jgi:uncharacterized membrane protein YgcG
MIKKLTILPLVFFCAAILLPVKTAAQNTQDFNFESFDAEYYLQKAPDGSSLMSVNETLVADFPGYDQNHGILRAIPEVYDGHSVNLTGISVTQDGKPARYTTSNQNDNLVLRIGDPATYVHNSVTYRINYTMHDITKPFSDHDELFWDINGDQWQQNFNKVSVRIHIPTVLSKQLQDKQLCYEGIRGSISQNCTISRADTGNEIVVTSLDNNVGPNQTLSVVLGFKPGTFKLSNEAQKEAQKKKLEFVSAVALGAGLPLCAFIFMFGRWRQFGNDPKGRGVIIPEYEPPKGFDVINSDFLMQEKLTNKAVSATLIEQAVKGNLTIYEVPKHGLFGKTDYELALNVIPEDNSQEANKLLQAIFDDNLSPGTKVAISSFKKDTGKQMAMYSSLKALEKLLALNLFTKGFFKKDPKSVATRYATAGYILVGITALAAGAINTFGPLGIGLAVGVVVSGFIIMIFSLVMPARTETGVQAHDDLLGLKDYIKMAEADRLKFLQSPEGAEKLPVAEAFDPKAPEAKVKLFEKLLPYAIIFGLEKDWAKQFEGIYVNPPSWYQGGNWTAFNTGYLIGALDGFSNASAVSFASPSSSSGSGFGGGGAGGGGGGGGGGGW